VQLELEALEIKAYLTSEHGTTPRLGWHFTALAVAAPQGAFSTPSLITELKIRGGLHFGRVSVAWVTLTYLQYIVPARKAMYSFWVVESVNVLEFVVVCVCPTVPPRVASALSLTAGGAPAISPDILHDDVVSVLDELPLMVILVFSKMHGSAEPTGQVLASKLMHMALSHFPLLDPPHPTRI